MKKTGQNHAYASIPSSLPPDSSKDADIPSPEEIDNTYTNILAKTLTDPIVCDRLIRTQTIEQKWKFIQIHRKYNQEKSNVWGEKEKDLLHMIDSSSNPDIQMLLRLKVILASSNKDLLSGFLTNKGVTVLVKIILQRVNSKFFGDIDAAMVYETLLCLKQIMNSTIGMKGILEFPGSIDAVALCLKFEFKHLALLVIEILTVVCYSDLPQAVSSVFRSLQLLSRKNQQPSYSYLGDALTTQDVETKLAIMQMIQQLFNHSSDAELSAFQKALLTIDMSNKVREANKQLSDELYYLGFEESIISTIKNAKVPNTWNMDKISTEKIEAGNLIAFKNLQISDSAASSQSPPAKKSEASKQRRIYNYESSKQDLHRAGILFVAAEETGCMGAKLALEPKWHTVDGESLRCYAGTQSDGTVEYVLHIKNIRDTRSYITDRNLLKLSMSMKIQLFEIVTEEKVIVMGCSTTDERDSWLKSLQACRDQIVISRSSYHMQRPHLAVKDAIAYAARLRNLCNDYNLHSSEYDVGSILASKQLGFDDNDVFGMLRFLEKEVMASGVHDKLIDIVRELMLVPAMSKSMWETIVIGIRHLRRVYDTKNGHIDPTIDSATSFSELLLKKSDSEGGSYEHMSKLAQSLLLAESELVELKLKIKELEETGAQNDSVSSLEDGPSEEDDSQHLFLLKKMVSQMIANSHIDKAAHQSMEGALKKQETTMRRLKETNELLVREQEVLRATVLSLEKQIRELHESKSVSAAVSFASDIPNSSPMISDEKNREGADGEKDSDYLDDSLMMGSFDEYADAAAKSSAAAAVAKKETVAGVEINDAEAVPLSMQSNASSERLAKYTKMKGMLPEGAVRQKMSLDGFSQQEIDAFFSTHSLVAIPASASTSVGVASSGLSDDSITAAAAALRAPVAVASPPPPQPNDKKYAKFIKMKAMLPEGAVRQKMALDGISQAEIDAFMTGTVSSRDNDPTITARETVSEAREARESSPIAAAVSSGRLEKYEKMKKALPLDAIRNRMLLDGCSPDDIVAALGNSASPETSAGASLGASLGKTVGTSLGNKGAGKASSVNQTPPKTKALYWTKLDSAHLADTVWKDVPKFQLVSDQQKLIEAWFSAKPVSVTITVEDKASKKTEYASSKYVTLLDPKRTQNILIVLGKLRKSPQEITKIIEDLDPKVLTVELTNTIKNILPTKDELQVVTNYPEPLKLDQASQLCYYVSKIPRLGLRIQCHEVVFSWFAAAQQISSQLAAIDTACQELDKCQGHIASLLSILLSIGNYMNSSGKFGGADGVKLEVLGKLSTVKASNAALGSMLNFLAMLANKESPDLITFTDSWKGIWAAADMPLKNLLSDVNSLDSQLNLLSGEHTRIKDSVDGQEQRLSLRANPLYQRIDGFLVQAKPIMLKIHSQGKALELSVEARMSRYGENYRASADEDNSKRFFQIFAAFGKCLRAAHDENVRKEKAAERQLRLAAEQNARAAAKSQSSAASVPSLTPAPVSVSVSAPVSVKSSVSIDTDNIFHKFHEEQDDGGELSPSREKYRQRVHKSMRLVGRVGSLPVV